MEGEQLDIRCIPLFAREVFVALPLLFALFSVNTTLNL